MTGVFIIAFWVYYSYTHPNSYFAAPIHFIATITIGVFVSYYLVQANTDKRKRYDLAEKLLEQAKNKTAELLSLLHNANAVDRRALGLKRAINNKIASYKDLKIKNDSLDKLSACEQAIRDLDAAIEDWMTSNTTDENSINDFRNKTIAIIENIENHCDKMIVEVWK